MSQAIVVPASFNGTVAAAFQGQQAADDLSGGITGGYGLIKYRGKVWSIQYQGNSVNLMRDDGDGPRGSIDVVIVRANANLSKTWYENGWDESNSNPPDCASANGVTPDNGVPKKQATVCAMCPRNAWGSAPNGGKGKACGDHRRLAVVPLTDLTNEHFGGPLLLRCPAASLQDMAAFDARYKQLGYPYFTMGIKISFDPQESFPKFQFAAIRPLAEPEAQIIVQLRDDPRTMRVVNEGAAPATPAIAQNAPAAFLEPAPANAVQPQQVAVQPAGHVAQPAPAAAPQPGPVAGQPVVQTHATAGNGAAPTHVGQAAQSSGFGPVAVPPAAQPAAQPAAAPVNAGGFGPAAGSQPAAPAPAGQPQVQPAVQAAPAAQAAPVRPAQVMTGFGVATPEGNAPAAPAAAPAGPVAGPNISVSEFEGSIDDRLAALINS